MYTDVKQIEKDVRRGVFEKQVNKTVTDWERLLEASTEALINSGLNVEISQTIVSYAYDERDKGAIVPEESYADILKNYATIIDYLLTDGLIKIVEPEENNDTPF